MLALYKIIGHFINKHISFSDDGNEETKRYIYNEIHDINYRRLRIIILIPLLLGFLSLLFSAYGISFTGRFLKGTPDIITLIRTSVFSLMAVSLFLLGRARFKQLLHIFIFAWIILIITLTYTVMDFATMIQLILEIFLLNLFLFLPPRFSFIANSAIFLTFVLFRFFADSPYGQLVRGGGITMMIPIFITFFILLVVVWFLGFYEFKDIIRQIYLRKVSTDQMETIKAQKEKLEEMNGMRDHVDRIVRHDLKTPLNGILGATQILLQSDDKDGHELASVIEQSGYKMLHMINNSLDLYQMEDGTYTLKTEEFELTELLKELEGEISSAMRIKNIGLSYNFIPPEAKNGVHIEAEKIKVAAMIANLLKNAADASPEGETITVTLDNRNPDYVSVHIHNVGVVPEEVRDSFFERYATAGKKDGTGLGTYSAKLVVEAHHGEISFSSSETEGTSLHLKLPRTQESTGSAEESSGPAEA